MVRKDKLSPYHGEFLVNWELKPTQQHQAYDELIQKEKEFAACLYFQKDKDRYF